MMKQEIDPDEYARIQTMLEYEREHWQQNESVAGIDEAGRGPLAGPVVAAAVVFAQNPGIPLINDSKKLTEKTRVELFDKIIQQALFYGIGFSDVDEIDKINIYQASVLAMKRAIENLKTKPDHLLIDGKSVPIHDIPFTPIVKGDSKSYSIAAASILAKVTRDRIMVDYDKQFPVYGFGSHKGYATKEHLDAIEEFGFCEIHRRSFHPKRFIPTTRWLFENDENFA